jgi:uncharacterized membrane protein
MNIIITALIALPILVSLELVWLRVIAKNFYQRELSTILLPKPNPQGAIAFYLMYPLALAYFVVVPAIISQSVYGAFGTGMLFGLAMYATCEFTNLAMVKGWTNKVVFVNLCWGACTTSVSSVITYYLATIVLGT